MPEILPGLVELVLVIFCLVDCIQSPSPAVRNLPKVVWLLLILLLPIIGSVAWLIAGRPQSGSAAARGWHAGRAGFPEDARPSTSAAIAEIDERLRRETERVDREHEEALRRWEQSLREREQRLGNPEPGPPAPPAWGTPDSH